MVGPRPDISHRLPKGPRLVPPGHLGAQGEEDHEAPVLRPRLSRRHPNLCSRWTIRPSWLVYSRVDHPTGSGGVSGEHTAGCLSREEDHLGGAFAQGPQASAGLFPLPAGGRHDLREECQQRHSVLPPHAPCKDGTTSLPSILQVSSQSGGGCSMVRKSQHGWSGP